MPRRNPTLDTAKAFRLAAADFHYYMLDPNAIASICKMSKQVADRIRASEAYKEHMESLLAQQRAQVDREMEKETKSLRLAMSSLVPQAIEVMRGHMEDSDGVVSLQAAREVLDRDGRMPKVSRVQSEIKDVSKIPDVDERILAEFQPAAKPN